MNQLERATTEFNYSKIDDFAKARYFQALTNVLDKMGNETPLGREDVIKNISNVLDLLLETTSDTTNDRL